MLKKILFFVILILVVYFSLLIAGGKISKYLSEEDALANADVILVISGGSTNKRVLEGIRLYKLGYAHKIIFAGAALDDGVSNAEIMENIAIKENINPDDIIIDVNSKNTLENALNIRSLLPNLTYNKVILVTSPYHLRRSYLTFRKILPDDIAIIRHIAPDSNWSSNTWYKSSFGRFITVSELWKIAFIKLTGRLSL